MVEACLCLNPSLLSWRLVQSLSLVHWDFLDVIGTWNLPCPVWCSEATGTKGVVLTVQEIEEPCQVQFGDASWKK